MKVRCFFVDFLLNTQYLPKRRYILKFLYKTTTYEAIESSSTTEKKILSAVKNARKRDNNKENKLYRVGGVVRDEIFGAKSKDIDYLVTNG